MNTEWKISLAQTGAIFDTDNLVNFGSPDTEYQSSLTQPICAPLTFYAPLKISGNDAQTFLQGQFTNDVKQVTTEQGQLNAWCSAKGRILSNFYLLQWQDAYYLILPRDSLATVQKRLQMFVLRADVQIEDCSDSLMIIGFTGHIDDALNTDYSAISDEKQVTMRLSEKRYLTLQSVEDAVNVIQSTELIKVGYSAWQLLDVLDGFPQITPATSDEFIPQMVNLHLLNGVNFKKGCYAGQEIVARMQYLGNLKQRMYRLQIDSNDVPQTVDAIEVNGAKVGTVLSAQTHPDGGCAALAILQISHAETGGLSWQGHAANVVELPYAFEQEAA